MLFKHIAICLLIVLLCGCFHKDRPAAIYTVINSASPAPAQNGSWGTCKDNNFLDCISGYSTDGAAADITAEVYFFGLQNTIVDSCAQDDKNVSIRLSFNTKNAKQNYTFDIDKVRVVKNGRTLPLVYEKTDNYCQANRCTLPTVKLDVPNNYFYFTVKANCLDFEGAKLVVTGIQANGTALNPLVLDIKYHNFIKAAWPQPVSYNIPQEENTAIFNAAVLGTVGPDNNYTSHKQKHGLILSLYEQNSFAGLGISAMQHGCFSGASFSLFLKGVDSYCQNSSGFYLSAFSGYDRFSGMGIGVLIGGPSDSGLMLGAINASGSIKGVHIGAFNISRFLKGVQIGLSNTYTNFSYQKGDLYSAGVQIGLINGQGNFKGVQIGVINAAINLKGVQIGIINMVGNRKFGFMPIVNIGL